jgi:hypothetical protein
VSSCYHPLLLFNREKDASTPGVQGTYIIEKPPRPSNRPDAPVAGSTPQIITESANLTRRLFGSMVGRIEAPAVATG